MKKLTLITAIILTTSILLSINLKSQNNSLSGIDEFILGEMESYHVPGLSAVIIKGDSVIWNNNYGYMNLEDSIPVSDSTLFNVFSIGKSITTACVMQLWDKQVLGLDQNINDFLPFQIDNYWNDDSITARMLMSHTASLKDGNIYDFVTIGDPDTSLSYFIENFYGTGGEYYSAANFYNLTTGTAFHYSNYGIGVLGYLVEPLTGIEFNQYVNDSLLSPLSMNSSAWFLNELNMDKLATGYEYGGGIFQPKLHYGHPAYPGLFLRSTGLELANYVIMLLNDGVYNNANILSSAAIDSMTTVQNPYWIFSYGTTGLGLFERVNHFGDRTVWGHNGGSSGGYAAHFYVCKEENTGIVITTNSEQYVDPIVEYLFDYADSLINITPEKLQSKQIKLHIFPNPAKNKITISTKDGLIIKEINIYNQIGQRVIHKKGISKTVDVSKLRQGMYIIEIEIDNGKYRSKLIIE